MDCPFTLFFNRWSDLSVQIKKINISEESIETDYIGVLPDFFKDCFDFEVIDNILIGRKLINRANFIGV